MKSFRQFLKEEKISDIEEISNFKKESFEGYTYENGIKVKVQVNGYTFNINGFGKYDNLLYGIWKSDKHWIMIEVETGFKIAEDYMSNRTKIIKKGLNAIKLHL